MRLTSLLTATVVALGVIVATAPSEAVPRMPHISLSSDLVFKSVIHRRGHWTPGHGQPQVLLHYCRRWRHACAARWGSGHLVILSLPEAVRLLTRTRIDGKRDNAILSAKHGENRMRFVELR